MTDYEIIKSTPMTDNMGQVEKGIVLDMVEKKVPSLVRSEFIFHDVTEEEEVVLPIQGGVIPKFLKLYCEGSDGDNEFSWTDIYVNILGAIPNCFKGDVRRVDAGGNIEFDAIAGDFENSNIVIIGNAQTNKGYFVSNLFVTSESLTFTISKGTYANLPDVGDEPRVAFAVEY